MKAICITIPKKIKWEDYKKELKAVEDGSQVLNFKVPNLPKDIKTSDVAICVMTERLSVGITL